MRHAVYRHYDVENALLYVGITINPLVRSAGHRSTAAWFKDVARIEIDWVDSEEIARSEEARLVLELKPKYNRAITKDKKFIRLLPRPRNAQYDEVRNRFVDEASLLGIRKLSNKCGICRATIQKMVEDPDYVPVLGTVLYVLGYFEKIDNAKI